jgi:hypothetical protein
MRPEPHVEREYPYSSSWKLVGITLGLSLLCLLLAGMMVLAGAGPERRVGLFRGAVPLPAGSSKGIDLYGVVCFGTVAVLLGGVGVYALLNRGRVAVTPEGLLVPKSLRTERLIPYDRITRLSVDQLSHRRNDRFLRIEYRGEQTGAERLDTVLESKLREPGAFDELLRFLERRARPRE